MKEAILLLKMLNQKWKERDTQRDYRHRILFCLLLVRTMCFLSCGNHKCKVWWQKQPCLIHLYAHLWLSLGVHCKFALTKCRAHITRVLLQCVWAHVLASNWSSHTLYTYMFELESRNNLSAASWTMYHTVCIVYALRIQCSKSTHIQKADTMVQNLKSKQSPDNRKVMLLFITCSDNFGTVENRYTRKA